MDAMPVLPRMLLSLVFGAGLLSASATASAAKDIFVLEDPRGDDFGAGDLVTFPAGMSCTWEVHGAVKKHYTFG